MRRVVLLLLLLSACGENVPPTVETMRISNPRLQRGQQFYLTLIGVEDPDGDIFSGQVRVKTTSVDGSVELEDSISPSEPEREQTRGDLIVGVFLTGNIPVGGWKIEAVYEDAGGAQADPVWTALELTP
jgi:hypothetical protein